MKSKIFIFLTILCIAFSNSKAQCCRCCRAGDELIKNGDFSLGNTGFSTAYLFSNSSVHGRYGIVTNSRTPNPNNWASCTDHTTGTGKFAWFDLADTANAVMWSQKINNITPNANYSFSCWINTLYPLKPAEINFLINGLPAAPVFIAPATLCTWVQKTFVWNSGSSQAAIITLTNKSSFSQGNDIGIDDISFKKYSPISIVYPDVIICNGSSYTLPNGTVVNMPGTYSDTLPTADGCDSLRITTIKTFAQTNVEETICAGQTLLGYTTTGIYIDSFKTVNNCDSVRILDLTVNKNSFTALEKTICAGESFLGHTSSGIYFDTLRNATNCDSVINTKLTVKPNCKPYFPTAFTPNDDKKNDVFKVLNADAIENYKLTIYNKWGNKIFETKDYTFGWDGKLKNIKQPADAYTWQSSFTLLGVARNMKGTVMLLR